MREAGVCAMWLWHKIAAFFNTWYGTLNGTIGILSAIYNGLPTLFRTWDFLIDRFRDRPILEDLRDERIPKKLAPFITRGPDDASTTVTAMESHRGYSVVHIYD